MNDCQHETYYEYEELFKTFRNNQNEFKKDKLCGQCNLDELDINWNSFIFDDVLREM